VRPAAAEVVRSLLRGHEEARVLAVATSAQAESLAAGLQSLDEACHTPDDVILVTPVDMLPAALATHHALLASLTGQALAVTPVHRGRGGHPVIARRALLAPYEGAHVPPPLREVLATAGEARLRVEVEDPRVLGDLDYPADVRALRTGT
jgi:CTP:molybdopterin cytidylyltransferase MocA